MNLVSCGPEIPKPRRKRAARQRCFERESSPLPGELVQSPEHDPTGGDRDAFRIEGRESASNHVSIDELVDGERAMQKRGRSGRLPGAVRAGEDHDAGTRVTHVAALSASHAERGA